MIIKNNLVDYKSNLLNYYRATRAVDDCPFCIGHKKMLVDSWKKSNLLIYSLMIGVGDGRPFCIDNNKKKSGRISKVIY